LKHDSSTSAHAHLCFPDQVRAITEVTTAVAAGDLAVKICVDSKGEIRELGNAINTMVGQLNTFASEVGSVTLEVGTYGTLGGQVIVRLGGTWKDVSDHVNTMVANFTGMSFSFVGPKVDVIF